MVKKKICLREENQGTVQKVVLAISDPSGPLEIELPYAWQPGMFNQISKVLPQDGKKLAFISKDVNQFGEVIIRVEFTNGKFKQNRETQSY